MTFFPEPLRRSNAPYRQCLLVQTTLEGRWQLVSWLPLRFAVVGNPVRLRLGPHWSEPWVVAASYDPTTAESDLPDSHRAIKQHRLRTGDAERKPKR